MSVQALESPRQILQEIHSGMGLWVDQRSECASLVGRISAPEIIVYLPDFRLLLKKKLVEPELYMGDCTRYRLTRKALQFVE